MGRNTRLESTVGGTGAPAGRSTERVTTTLATAEAVVVGLSAESRKLNRLPVSTSPCPTTRVAGVNEVIVAGENGYVVDDAAGLTAMLEKMLALPAAERVAMGERGRARVLQDFTAARYVRQVEATYRECLA